MSAYPNQPQGGWPEQPPQYQASPPDYGYQPRRAPRRRRRRHRGLIALLIIVILLVVAFVVGDQVARSYAQNMIATKFQSDGFPVKPNVSIKGWPFLTQLASRDVRTVDISASDAQEGKLVIENMDATASGVHLNSSYNGATIDSINGTAMITYASIASDIGIPDATISADPSAGSNVAKVSAGPIDTTAQVSKVSGYQISVALQSVEGLPIQSPSYTLTLPHFPAGIELTGVSVTSQGLRVSFGAQNTTLSGSGS